MSGQGKTGISYLLDFRHIGAALRLVVEVRIKPININVKV